MKKILNLILLISSLSMVAQKQSISGKVTDDMEETIPGVTVFVKGTETGAYTDLDGAYNLNANVGDILIFSFVGMENKEVVVADATIINVVLKTANNELDEVVVVGYGTVKKSDLTGSVSSINAEELTKAGTISLDQALAGKAAGVTVTQSSGVPGAGATIKIRGISSMNGSEPLYVIDGVIIENTSLSSLQSEGEAGGQMSPLSSVNPEDIESMEILKDASSTAIYGSRGANGVIIITTKSGKIGKGVIKVDTEFGVSIFNNFIDVLDGNEYWITKSIAARNAGNSQYSNETFAVKLDSARAGQLKTTDWQKSISQTGYSQNHNLSLRGGNQDMRYSVSSNLFNASGVIKDTDFSRASTRINLDANLNEKLSAGTRSYFAVVKSNQRSTTTNYRQDEGTNSIISRALRTSPTAALDATYLAEIDNEIQTYTPLEALEANDYDNEISEFSGNVFLNYKLSPKLSLRTTLSYTARSVVQRFYQKALLPGSRIQKNGWSMTSDQSVSQISNINTVTYNDKYSNGSSINAVFGQSSMITEWEMLRTSNYGYANDLLLYYAPGSSDFQDPDQIYYGKNQLASFFGRVNFNTLRDKLLLTLTGRYDGASKFAKNYKWGFFPAAAIGYKLSKENFMQNIDAISNLKLRMSYGLSGNQAVATYQSLDQLSTDKIVLGDGNGGEATSAIYYTSRLPNYDLRWETSGQFDIGMDLGLFNNRYTATFDYYKKETTDLLIANNPIPAHSGFGSYTENFGSLESYGYELAIKAHLINTNKVSWILNMNASTGKSKFTNLPADYVESGYNQGWVSGGTQRLIIGEEVGTFYGYKTTGIAQFDDFQEFQGMTNEEQIALYNQNLELGFDPNTTIQYTPVLDADGNGVIATTPGEQLYENLDGNTVINDSDKQIIGYAQPDLIFGINNSFTFGNVDFSFAIDGQLGQDLANVANFQLLSFDGTQQLSTVQNAWSPENQNNIYPRQDTNNAASGFKFSDRFIEDGSFVRLQNVTLAYRLPAKVLQPLGLTFLKVYASASNIYTISNYSGFNPDVSLTGSNNLSMGHDNAGYPVSMSIRMGLNIQF